MTLTAADCLDRIRKNDKQFLDELMLIIRRIAAKWNWTDESTLSDICQDCYIKVVQNLEAGKFQQQSSFKTYLYSIVRFTCLDYYKATKAADWTDIEKVELVDQNPSQSDSLISKEERRTAARVLLALPRECRRLWQTIFFGKRNYRQAADELGLTEGTVKRKMWECRKQARELVASYEK